MTRFFHDINIVRFDQLDSGIPSAFPFASPAPVASSASVSGATTLVGAPFSSAGASILRRFATCVSSSSFSSASSAAASGRGEGASVSASAGGSPFAPSATRRPRP